MTSTRLFPLCSSEHQNYVDLLLALWPHLKWRHAGFGALQAYIREGEEQELRVHLWHPGLVKEGIVESGLCHDHRFDMRSNVIVGGISQTDFELEPDIEGDWETWQVLHAREAMKTAGSFHKDPVQTGTYYRRYPKVYQIPAGRGYTFDKFCFHETRAHKLTITLVEKTQQEDVNARILAPRDKPLVHAFSETLKPEQFEPFLTEGYVALVNARLDVVG